MARPHLSVLDRLFVRRTLGAKFSLDRVFALSRALGNPQDGLKFIHIAGTNGKGSVAAMSASILQEAGFRTGLYTSPHLVRFHERFRIDGVEIADEELRDLLDVVLRHVRDETFFEITTVLALCWFARRKVDWVVWETGLGGRLDATNIVTPEVSVITHIGLDHQAFLGNSIEEIAVEKAGIIKQGKPVITPDQKESILKVFRERAEKSGAPLTILYRDRLEEFPSPLSGAHQAWNTALAVAAVRRVMPGITPEEIRIGLGKTVWPGRCQIIHREGKPAVLLDGAHNLPGVEVLVSEIRSVFGDRSLTLIFGALADKPVENMARLLKPIFDKVLLVPVSSERNIPVTELLRFFPGSEGCHDLVDAIRRADERGNPVVLTGSLFLVGEALLRLTGSPGRSHPAEWLHAAQ